MHYDGARSLVQDVVPPVIEVRPMVPGEDVYLELFGLSG